MIDKKMQLRAEKIADHVIGTLGTGIARRTPRELILAGIMLALVERAVREGQGDG